MPFVILPTQKDRIWTIRHTGHLDIDEIERAICALGDLFRDEPLQGLLVDLRVVTRAINQADYLRWLEARKLPHIARKIAMISNPGIEEELEFMALAGQNRGMVLWVFQSSREAMKWLSARSPGSL